MTVVFTQGSLTAAMEDFLADAAFPTLVVRLYKNNHTPTSASILTDFTEADFTSYADLGLPISPTVGWDGTKVTATFPLLTWTTGDVTNLPQTIYGYVVWNTADSSVWWAEKFAVTPTALTLAGQTFQLTVVISDQNSP
jgi:hypothetical protein